MIRELLLIAMIGSSGFIGTNATIIQKVSIGNYCMIGAGTTITRNVEDYYMVYKDYKKYWWRIKHNLLKGCVA